MALKDFAVAIIAGVVLNAIVCGAVSGPWGRYQARVVWLIPMAALLMLEQRRRLQTQTEAAPVIASDRSHVAP
jgi:hypothetical protein